jgi:hypothetical protein
VMMAAIAARRAAAGIWPQSKAVQATMAWDGLVANGPD